MDHLVLAQMERVVHGQMIYMKLCNILFEKKVVVKRFIAKTL
jgi:hypothetical protein